MEKPGSGLIIPSLIRFIFSDIDGRTVIAGLRRPALEGRREIEAAKHQREVVAARHAAGALVVPEGELVPVYYIV